MIRKRVQGHSNAFLFLMRNRDEIGRRDKSVREIQNDRVRKTVPYEVTQSALSQSFSQFCQKEEILNNTA